MQRGQGGDGKLSNSSDKIRAFEWRSLEDISSNKKKYDRKSDWTQFE